MARILEFITNHPLNVVAFAMMVGLLIFYEMSRRGKAWAPKQLVELMNSAEQQTAIIDLRGEQDFNHGHIINSINHPYTKVKELPDLLAKHKEENIVLVCANGRHSASAQQQAKSKGYQVSRLNGGLVEWSVAGLPLEKRRTKGGKPAKPIKSSAKAA